MGRAIKLLAASWDALWAQGLGNFGRDSSEDVMECWGRPPMLPYMSHPLTVPKPLGPEGVLEGLRCSTVVPILGQVP